MKRRLCHIVADIGKMPIVKDEEQPEGLLDWRSRGVGERPPERVDVKKKLAKIGRKKTTRMGWGQNDPPPL